MSIILRDDRSFGGTAYPAGTTLSLDGALEANLVAQGLATWAGQAPYQGGATQTVQLAVDDRGHITGLVGRNGTAGFVDAGLFGASPDASAAVNTAAIQAALDVGGLVTIRQAGTYLINDTLEIDDDTEFVLAPGVEIKAGAVMGELLITSKLTETPTTVTLTWVSNAMTCSVAWTGHGMTTEDHVWLTGSDQYQYLGVFPIISVTDENNFVVKLKRMPTASPTGTAKCIKAAQNIGISGGIWNYNYTGGNTGGSGYNLHALRLGGVYNLYLENIRGRDTNKYVADIGAVSNLRFIGGYGAGLHSDFMKLRGPLFDAKVFNLEASAGDDILSLQNREPPAYESSNWTWGDIIGCDIYGVGGYSSSASIVLYPNSLGIIDGIKIDGLASTVAGTSLINLRIDNNWGSGVGNIGSVVMTVPNFNGKNTAIGWLGDTTTQSLVLIAPKAGANRLFWIPAAAINANIKVIGGYLSGVDNLLNNSSSGVVNLELDGVREANPYIPFQIGGSGTTNIKIRNGYTMAANPSGYFLNVSGASSPTITIDADQITNPSGAQTVNTTGTPTLKTAGPGLKCDHSVFSTVSGAVTYNSNAGYGAGVGLYATGAGSPVKLA